MAAPLYNALGGIVFRLLRPVLRVVSGLVAIPVFRFLLRRVMRMKTTDAELERDLELWFRGSVIMLAATHNMEGYLFGWFNHNEWLPLLLRLLLAVAVIENMPDQELFSILHRGPPRLKLTSRAGWCEAWGMRMQILKGLGILHLKRSSPVFVMMTCVFGAEQGKLEFYVGWWCYGLAITQYLIIGLITDRTRADGLLRAFDRQTATIRADLARNLSGRTGNPDPQAEAFAGRRGYRFD